MADTIKQDIRIRECEKLDEVLKEAKSILQTNESWKQFFNEELAKQGYTVSKFQRICGVSYNTVKKGTCTYEYSRKKKEGKYEVKFRSGGYKYEYEILAPNGKVMEYEKKLI